MLLDFQLKKNSIDTETTNDEKKKKNQNAMKKVGNSSSESFNLEAVVNLVGGRAQMKICLNTLCAIIAQKLTVFAVFLVKQSYCKVLFFILYRQVSRKPHFFAYF